MHSSETDIPTGPSPAGHPVPNTTDAEEARELERLRARFDQGAALAQPIFWEYDIAADRIAMGDDEFTRAECARFGWPAVFENATTSVLDVIADQDREAYSALLRQVRAGHDAVCEVWYKSAAGCEPQCGRESYKVACNADGVPVTAYGMGTNVTVQKNAEKRYEQDKARLLQKGSQSIASFHLNLTKDWVGEGRSDLSFVLNQQKEGTVAAYLAEFSKLIADDNVKEWFLATFQREKLIAGFREGKTAYTFEYPVIYQNGTRHWSEGHLDLLQNPHTGDVEGITYALDIDKRKYADMTMKVLSGDLFAFSILLDMKTGKIIFGGQTHPGTKERYRDEDYAPAMVGALKGMMPADALESAIDAHSMQTIRNELAHKDRYEVALVTKNGRHLHWNIFYVDRESSIVLIIREDVTDIQKKLGQAEIEIQKALLLKDQNESLRRMIDGVPSGLVAANIRHGVFDSMLRLNRYFVERVDIAVDDDNRVSLQDYLDCLHPDDRDRARVDFHEFLKSCSAAARQYRFRNVAGKYYWGAVRGTIAKISDDEEIAYFSYADIDDLKTAEAKLKEGRLNYERTVDELQAAMWTYDIPNRRIVLGDNAPTEALRVHYGWPKVFENVPDSLLDTIEADGQERYLEMFRQVQAGHDASCEVWYRQQEGMEPRCERESYHVVCNEDGIPLMAYGVGTNVTAQKKVEERYAHEMVFLRNNSEESLIAKGHYDLTKNLVLEYDVRADKDVFVTNAGMTCDEACQNFVNMAYSDEDRRNLADKMNRAHLIQRYQQGQMQATMQYRMKTDDGNLVWHSTTVHTFMNPATGNLELFSYAYDITERKLIENVMDLVSEQAFDYIALLHVPDDSFQFVEKADYIAYPALRQKITFAQRCEYVSRNFIVADEKEQYESATSVEKAVAALRTSAIDTETYLRTENGKVLCKQLDYMWLDRETEMMLIVCTDVSVAYNREQEQVRKLAEAKLEAERANEAKSTFLSGMSHDIRTPLSGIVSFTNFALAEQDPTVAHGYMEKVKSSADLLLSLVNDVLDLSRIESGKATPELEPTPSVEMGASVVEALRSAAEAKGIRLISGPYPDKVVYVDKLKHQKIWLNLISNAIKYTPEGGAVEARVEVIDPPVDGHNRRLVVVDNGIGMSEEFQKTMFEPFSQERRSETQNIQGTGLGLAIVRRYVDLLGGAIKVHSVRGKGTRFDIDLDIKTMEESAADRKEEQQSIGALAGTRVLLCEDNDMNVEIVRILLNQKGIAADRAQNGSIGVQMFKDSEPGFYDAVLMDVRMPVMDGRQATRAIRALDRADAGRVPIIALTADAFEEDIRENREAGMNGYVTKPINPDKLYRALSDALDR